MNLEGQTIKALSWREPYGALMLPPWNKIETRSWNTKYRGLVLMCASKKSYPWNLVLEISGTDQFDRICEAVKPKNPGHGSTFYADYHGLAFAVGRLVESRPMIKEDEIKCFVEYREPSFVDNKSGKRVLKMTFCHVYEDVRPIKPIPWKGSQGFRNVDLEIIKQIEFIKTTI